MENKEHLYFYVVDDIRLKVHQQSECFFSDLDSAIDYYLRLPPSVVKVIGASTDGSTRLTELVCCLPLFGTDVAGEHIFMSKSVFLPLWKEPAFLWAAKELVTKLNVQFCLDGNEIIPAPTGKELPEHLEGKYLWRDRTNEPRSAIQELYVAGTGWITPRVLDQKFPLTYRDHRYPLVLKYRADGVDDQGHHVRLEMTPWEFKELDHRTQMRIDQNKNRRNPT